jgi:hypothetical protein
MLEARWVPPLLAANDWEHLDFCHMRKEKPRLAAI